MYRWFAEVSIKKSRKTDYFRCYANIGEENHQKRPTTNSDRGSERKKKKKLCIAWACTLIHQAWQLADRVFFHCVLLFLLLEFLIDVWILNKDLIDIYMDVYGRVDMLSRWCVCMCALKCKPVILICVCMKRINHYIRFKPAKVWCTNEQEKKQRRISIESLTNRTSWNFPTNY